MQSRTKYHSSKFLLSITRISPRHFKFWLTRLSTNTIWTRLRKSSGSMTTPRRRLSSINLGDSSVVSLLAGILKARVLRRTLAAEYCLLT